MTPELNGVSIMIASPRTHSMTQHDKGNFNKLGKNLNLRPPAPKADSNTY
jgi:hypothetical protein